MGIIREEIINNYHKLQQLEEYEDLIELLIGKSNKHWWKIVLPEYEFRMSDDSSRAGFINFIKSEIGRLKKDLGIND